MTDFKQVKEKIFPYDDHKFKIQRRIKKLKEIYDKHGLCISIITKSHNPLVQTQRIELIDKKSNNKVGDFFFYPTHKVYEYDGQEKRHFGFRICFVQSLQKITNTQSDTYVKIVSLNISNEMLKNGKWLKSPVLKGFKLKTKTIDIDAFVKSMYTAAGKELVVSSVIGWVKARNKFHYVPVTNSIKNGISSTKDIRQNFKYEVHNDMNAIQAYQKMKELLSVTIKEVTVPLLSFTVIALIQSLIKKYLKEPFMLCLCGDNEGHTKLLSNLFCNIYNRTSHLYELDTKLHANQSLKSDIPIKIERLRDAVFISKVEKRNDLKIYLKLLDDVSCGLLLINSSALQHDDVIDVNTKGASIDNSIVQYHKNNPAAFSTWFYLFIGYMQDKLEENGSESYLNKLHKNCMKQIEEYNPVELNQNKLRQCAWLLSGFRLFEQFGRKIEAINREEYQITLNEAIAIFHKMSSIDVVTDDEQESLLARYETDELAYLHTVDRLLTSDVLKPLGEKLSNQGWGWRDQEILYLRNEKVFEQVQEHLFKHEQINLESSKNVYKKLYNNKGTGVIIKRGKDGWGKHVKGINERVIHISIQNMKKFLKDHGYELAFLATL